MASKVREQPVAGEDLERVADDETSKFVNSLINECKKNVKAQHEQIRKARQFPFSQWDQADEAKLTAEGRPIPQVDLTRKYLNATGGIEIINKTTIHCLARVPDSIEAISKSELITGVYQATLDSSMGSFEHSEEFANLLRDGIACSGQWLDTTLEKGGKIMAGQRVDMLEMAWDTQDKTQNLENIRYVIRFRITPKWAAIDMWPEEEDFIKRSAHEGEINPIDEVNEVRHVTPFTYDPINTTKEANAKPKNYVTIKEAFWYENEYFHEMIDPFTGETKEMPESEFKEFKASFNEQFEDTEVQSVRRRRRVYKRAFIIRGKTMEEGNSPMQTGFPFKFMTGEWDPKENVWRGLLFALMEPQRLASKFMSQTMHILATGGKRTTFYEEGAFDNITEAEREMAQFNPFIKMADGALGSGGQGAKFHIEPPVDIPQGMFQMWQTFLELIRDTTGINIDMLGTATGEVPGVTTRQRRMAGLATVAMFFNSYRRFLIFEAPGIIEYIQKFYTDDRWIRIGGEFNSQVVQLAKKDVDIPWDYMIDDTPQSEDARMDRFKLLSESGILAQMVKSGAIFFVPSAMDDAPMSAKQRFQFQNYLKQGAQMQMQASQGGLPPGLGGKPGGKQESKGKPPPDPQLTAANVAKKNAETQLTLTKARAIDQEAQLKKLSAMSQHMLSMSDEKRAAQSHGMDMLSKSSELGRAHEAHHIDSYTQVSKHLHDMARADAPEAQV